MIKRLRVRRVPRRKRSGRMTGVIYLHGHAFRSQQVVVMDLTHYCYLRARMQSLVKRMERIKGIIGSLKYQLPTKDHI